MKPVDSLKPAKRKPTKKPKKVFQAYTKDRPRSSPVRKKTQIDQKKTVFLAMIVSSVLVIFIVWLFFLKVELRHTAEGGAFIRTISDFGKIDQAITVMFREIKDADFNWSEPENGNVNTNNSVNNGNTSCRDRLEVDPEIRELEKKVFPQFEE